MTTSPNIHQLCVDFVPICMVYLFASYPRDFVLVSGSTLGKFVAICIIAFYTSMNTMYGIFVCLLILVYYQTDFVEGILNIERGEWMEHQMIKMSAGLKREYAPANDKTTIADIPLVKSPPKADPLAEGFQANDPALFHYVPVRSYRSEIEDVLDKKEKKAELMAIFRKDNCENGALVHRGLEVHSEMADHVFREIQFNDEFRKCNPCNPACSFSIIEEKLNVESRLQTPVRANDDMDTYFNAIQGAFENTSATIYGYIPNLPSFSSFMS